MTPDKSQRRQSREDQIKAFQLHVAKANQVIESWPEWKRNLVGRAPSQQTVGQRQDCPKSH